jgi:hypothetical protein
MECPICDAKPGIPTLCISCLHNRRIISELKQIIKEGTGMINLSENSIILTVTKDRVLEASKKCPQAKEVLKSMFPEVFEEKMYKCGTIFVDQGFKDSMKFPLLMDNHLNKFWILAHLKDDRTYGLINMRTGYASHHPNQFYGRKGPIFLRRMNNEGVVIPEETLKEMGLEVHSSPPNKESIKYSPEQEAAFLRGEKENEAIQVLREEREDL